MKFSVLSSVTTVLATITTAQMAFAATINIQLWDQEDPEPGKLIEQWVKDFNKENKGIEVTRTTYQTEDLRQKFIVSATAGKAAEMVWGPNDMAGTLVTAGLIQEVKPPFAKPEDFFQPALDAARLDGKYWGIPMTYGNHLMLFYNKDMVKTAPKTTDELIAVAKAHTKPNEKKYGLVLNNNEPYWLAPILGGFGGWPLVEEKGKVEISLNTPAMEGALQFLADLKFKHKVIPNDCDIDTANGLFNEGKAAMLINGDWNVDNARKNLGDKVGIAALPIISATGKPMSPMVGGKYIFINKKLKDQATAVAVIRFIQFIASKEKQVEMAIKLGRIPALKAAQADPAVQGNEVIKLVLDASLNGKAMPPQVEMRAAWDGMRPLQAKVMGGEEKAKSASEKMQKLAMERLKGLEK